ncbi:MAG: hypothetical protein HQM16_14440 [Deltaproteobacteria bacterium]|nr:hypothetical protein [Deltaproteobacteria bacterium]
MRRTWWDRVVFMVTYFKQILCLHLICFLVWSPCTAQGKIFAKKSVAVVEVYQQSPTDQLSRMHLKLESFLDRSDKVTLIRGQRVDVPKEVKIKKERITKNPQVWTSGDEAFSRAKDLYLASNFSAALAKVRLCIGMLTDNPGISGNIVNAYLLKSQIEFEIGNDDAATASAMKAISYNVDEKILTHSSLSPRTRFLYKKAYDNFMATNNLTDMTVNVENGETFPIYINGVFRGAQSSITVKVPRNMTQIVSVGSNMRRHLVQASKPDNVVVVSAYDENLPVFTESPVTTSYHSLGMINTFFPSLVSLAQGMGRDVGAEQVALIKLESIEAEGALLKKKKLSGQYQMLLSVVDVKSGNVSVPQLYAIPDIEVDADRVAKMASDYIATTTKTSFAAVNTNYWSGAQVAALQRAMDLQQSPVLNQMATIQPQDEATRVAALKTGKHLEKGKELEQISDPKKKQTPKDDADETRTTEKKPEAKDKEKAKKKKTLMYALIGAAVVVVGGGIGAIVALAGGGSSGGGSGGGGSGGESSVTFTGPVPTTPPP